MAEDGGVVVADGPIIDADAMPSQAVLAASDSARKAPTPPTGPAPGSGVSSKLNSLKERRQAATPPQVQPKVSSLTPGLHW